MANGWGGPRPNAGRPPGTGKTTAERRSVAMQVFQQLHAADVTPLHIFGRMMQGDTSVTPEQFEAAKAAAPYMHPRLTAITMETTVRKSIMEYTDGELLELIGVSEEESESGIIEAELCPE